MISKDERNKTGWAEEPVALKLLKDWIFQLLRTPTVNGYFYNDSVFFVNLPCFSVLEALSPRLIYPIKCPHMKIVKSLNY